MDVLVFGGHVSPSPEPGKYRNGKTHRDDLHGFGVVQAAKPGSDDVDASYSSCMACRVWSFLTLASLVLGGGSASNYVLQPPPHYRIE